MVRGDADEDGLAAAALGEKELARREARVHGDGVGALEVADRAPEGFGDTEPLPQVVLDLQRNDLGVGGDIGVDASAAAFEGFFELMEVVDVAVQAGVDDAGFAGGTRSARLSTGWQLASVMAPTDAQRVWALTVWNSAGKATIGVQQGIARDGAAQEPDVVPQAADFNRHLVGERDGDGIGVAMGGDPLVQEGLQGQAAGEFLLQAALAERGAEVLVVGGAEREQQRDPGGVPAPHLHAVDAVQDRVDVAEDVDGGGQSFRSRPGGRAPW